MNSKGTTMSAGRGLVALGAALVAGTLTFMPTAASAGTGHISINTGNGWTHDSADPLLTADRIAPGWSESAVIGIRNDGDTGELAVESANIVDDENGCNHPESLVDTTCSGDDAGELGHQLIFSIYADPERDGTFESTPVWTGTLYDITTAHVLSSAMPTGATWDYRVDAALPMSSGNETQTDHVSFNLRWLLDGAGVDVQGLKVTRGMTGGDGVLPFTGGPIAGTLGLGLGLVALGLLMRVRRRSIRVPSRATKGPLTQ